MKTEKILLALLVFFLLFGSATAQLPPGVSIEITKQEEKTEPGKLAEYDCPGGGPHQFKHKLGSWGIIVASGHGVTTSAVAAAIESATGQKLKKTVTVHTTFGKPDFKTVWSFEHKTLEVEGYVKSASQGSNVIGRMPAGAIGKFKATIPISDSASKTEEECPVPPPPGQPPIGDGFFDVFPPDPPQPPHDDDLIKDVIYTPGTGACKPEEGKYTSFNDCLAACQPPNYCQGGPLDPSGCWICKPGTQVIERVNRVNTADLSTGLIDTMVQRAPKELSGFIATEMVALNLQSTDKTIQKAGIEIQNGKVKNIEKQKHFPNSTLKIFSTQRVVESILYSSDPQQAFIKAFSDGGIAINSPDPAKGLPLGAAKSVLRSEIDVSPDKTIKYDGYAKKIIANNKGMPFIETPGNAQTYFNQYASPMAYSSQNIQKLARHNTAQLSRSAGLYSQPPKDVAYGPKDPIEKRLSSTQTTGRNFFKDVIDHGRSNGGMLHNSGLYIGPPPGAYTGPPAGAYIGPPQGAYTGPPPGAFTGLYRGRR